MLFMDDKDTPFDEPVLEQNVNRDIDDSSEDSSEDEDDEIDGDGSHEWCGNLHPGVAICISGGVRSFPREAFRASFDKFRKEMPPSDVFLVLKMTLHSGTDQNWTTHMPYARLCKDI